jgi:hypothetical protein
MEITVQLPANRTFMLLLYYKAEHHPVSIILQIFAAVPSKTKTKAKTLEAVYKLF